MRRRQKAGNDTKKESFGHANALRTARDATAKIFAICEAKFDTFVTLSSASNFHTTKTRLRAKSVDDDFEFGASNDGGDSAETAASEGREREAGAGKVLEFEVTQAGDCDDWICVDFADDCWHCELGLVSLHDERVEYFSALCE